MTRIAIYLTGAALALAIPFSAGAQDIGGSVSGAVSGAVEGAGGSLGVDGNAGSRSGLGIDNDGVSLRNDTNVRANVTVEEEEKEEEQASKRRRDATVTGSVKSAIGGECDTQRDGICRD